MGQKKPKKVERRKSKNDFTIAEIPTINAPNFSMNAADFTNYLPIKDLHIKRAYWITDVKNEMITGQHAHKDDEEEIFIIVSGGATMVYDAGEGKKIVKVKKNNIVWVPRLTWHGFINLSPDFMLMALTTTNYDPERKGYVTDYEEFKKLQK